MSPETVYKAFGSKAGLMKALWDVTLAGDDQPVAITDRRQMQEVRSAADPAEKLRRWAGFVRGANQRLAPLYGLLAQAGPEVAQLLATTQRERLTADRGWHPGQYEDWLTRMLIANLLAPASPAPASSREGAT